MKYYLAPLEGITNSYYRRIFSKYFNNVDKFFIPFINPAQYNLSHRDLREIDINNNRINKDIVPQIISNNSKETIWLINKLKDDGYKEVNLNFGCPSGTVVSKYRGGGILKDLSLMDNYLKEVFSSTTLPISIKIRLGIENVSEFEDILKILNKYDIKELIIHPRTVKEKYNGDLHLDIFNDLNNKTNIPIVYNGEIKNLDDIKYIQNRFPYLKGIMIGRGLISIPDLLEDNKLLTDEERINKIKCFYNELYNEFLNKFGYNNTKFFAKEIWVQLINYFEVDKKTKKQLFKSEKQIDLENNINYIFNNCKINKNIESGIKKYIKNKY